MSSSIPRIHIDVSDSCTNCCTGSSCCWPKRKSRVVVNEEGEFNVQSHTEEVRDAIQQKFSPAARKKAAEANLKTRQRLHQVLEKAGTPVPPEIEFDPQSTLPLSHQELHLLLDLAEQPRTPLRGSPQSERKIRQLRGSPQSERKTRQLPTPPPSYSPGVSPLRNSQLLSSPGSSPLRDSEL